MAKKVLRSLYNIKQLINGFELCNGLYVWGKAANQTFKPINVIWAWTIFKQRSFVNTYVLVVLDLHVCIYSIHQVV